MLFCRVYALWLLDYSKDLSRNTIHPMRNFCHCSRFRLSYCLYRLLKFILDALRKSVSKAPVTDRYYYLSLLFDKKQQKKHVNIVRNNNKSKKLCTAPRFFFIHTYNLCIHIEVLKELFLMEMYILCCWRKWKQTIAKIITIQWIRLRIMCDIEKCFLN